MHAALGQDPFAQGYQTASILYDYIIDGKEPASSFVRTKIDIGLQENIELACPGRWAGVNLDGSLSERRVWKYEWES